MRSEFGYDVWQDLEDYLNYIIDKEIVTKEFLLQRLRFLPSDMSVKTVENNDKIPILLDAFMDFRYKHKRIPSQKEYAKNFVCKNWGDKEVRRLLKRKNLRNALYLRLFRAYPSFVRDALLYGYLKYKKVNISYDYEKDIRGVDFVIVGKSKTAYNIHCYVEASFGRTDWREKKNHRHNYTGVHIDLKLKRHQCVGIGNFLFYTDDQINRLITQTSE